MQQLGKAVGAILSIAYPEHDDIAAWGAPSECRALVARYNDSLIRQVIEKTSLTPVEFLAEVEARTSSKWVHESGLGDAVPTMRCDFGCGVQYVTDESTAFHHHDPTTAYTLACGHTVI